MSEPHVTKLTVEITAAFVSHNTIQADELPGLISNVFGTLTRLVSPEVEPSVEVLKPAVPIRKSITSDYIICLEDGKKLKMLKRHLQTAYGMSPEDYRTKWGLPADYPMVAPNYAASRSNLAKQFGLGRRGGDVPVVEPAPAPAQEIPEAVAAPKPRRGRKAAQEPAGNAPVDAAPAHDAKPNRRRRKAA